MNKIQILYFSGTGMTKYLVEKICQNFNENNVDATCRAIDKVNPCEINIKEYDCIGIAYPVHAFNAPELVIKFAKHLPVSNGCKVFISYTAGENSITNNAASATLMKILRDKGYRIVLNRLTKMPSNFLMRTEDTDVKRLLELAEIESKIIVKRILDAKPFYDKASAQAKLLSIMGKAEWFGSHIMGKHFTTTDDCNLCKKCANNCSTNNISIVNDKVKFGWTCNMCMRCVYGCPSDAIKIRMPFGSVKIKPWYDIDNK